MADLILLFDNFLMLFTESAPWLLLGLFVAGVMHELVPVALLEKHMGGNSVGAISKAAFIGAPLPLCSCGVIPAALGLRRSGASKSSTISFLVSTPETGVDSVSVSYALLGPFFAVIRPIVAIVSAIYAGLMVRLLDKETHESLSVHQGSPCCAAKNVPTYCSKHKNESISVTTTAKKIWQFATGKLLEDIAGWLLIGLFFAAAIKTWVPTDFLTQWGNGFTAMIVMALVGVPMYICATASTPIAAGLLATGLSPGAVLVFLMAGPATNISTMGMIHKEMGPRTLVLYLFSVVSASIGFGYAVNWLVYDVGVSSLIRTEVSHHIHGSSIELVYWGCTAVLGALMLRVFTRYAKTKLKKPDPKSDCCH